MVEQRLPLLWAFAGGCLSGVLLLGFWRAEQSVLPPSPAHVTFNRGDGGEASRPRRKVRDAENEDAADDDSTAEDETATGANAATPKSTNGERAPKAAEEADVSAAEGSSVADVLNRLEKAYRQGLAGSKPADPPSANHELVALNDGAPARDDAREAPAPPPATTAAPAREGGAHEEPAAAPPVEQAASPAPAPAAAAPIAELPVEVAVAAPVPSPLPAGAAEQLAASGVAQPHDVYFGNVQNNVYMGNVYQGQVVQMEQQLALLQYMQLMSLSPYARFGARGRAPRGFVAAPAPAPAPAPTFKSTLTDPDNPWGFNFPQPNYVK